jgi:hypothetical protein
MTNTTSLRNATLVGTVLQLIMVVAGHYDAWIAAHLFMFGGMGISALAGLLFGWFADGYGAAALGGAIAGAVCALIGIAVSVVLGDTAAMILVIGTISSAVTGVIGGLIGRAALRARS